MSQESNRSEPQPAAIESRFIGNYPANWTAQPSSPRPLDSESMPSPGPEPGAANPDDDDGLRHVFAAQVLKSIADEMRKRDKGSATPGRLMDAANSLRYYYPALAAVLDPSSTVHLTYAESRGHATEHDEPAGPRQEGVGFSLMLSRLESKLAHMMYEWTDPSIWDVEGTELDEDSDTDMRIRGGSDTEAVSDSDSEDEAKAGDNENPKIKRAKEAQRTVPRWYGGRCALTGDHVTEAAHIIPLKVWQHTWRRANRHPGQLQIQLWCIWPPPGEFRSDLPAVENRNMLSLSPLVNALWDRGRIGLRPVPHPTDPDRRLYIQLVDFEHLFAEMHYPSDVKRSCTLANNVLCDHRGSQPRFLRHGDVYELMTADPTNQPLPRVGYLHIRHCMQKLFAAQTSSPDVLRTIFGERPPSEVQTPVRLGGDAWIPLDYRNMLQDAAELGILDEDSLQRWKRAIIEDTYQDAQSFARQGIRLARLQRRREKARQRRRERRRLEGQDDEEESD